MKFGGIGKFFSDSKNKIKKFWKTDNTKLALLRDVLFAIFLVLILLSSLWAYTGQWGGAPMVAIESGSMRHRNEPFGRFGTINAGDMVLLVNVEKRSDVIVHGGDYGGAQAQGNYDHYTYGDWGDVIVYRPDGDVTEDMIIHRAICWVEVENVGGEKTYTISEYGIKNHDADEPLYIPEAGIMTSYGEPIVVDFSNSGFITKGDNPDTNERCDQVSGLVSQPIKIEWVVGKARQELPWIGTINLLFNDITNGKLGDPIYGTVGNVPGDCIFCLVFLIILLISIPIILDIYDYCKDKDKKPPSFYKK